MGANTTVAIKAADARKHLIAKIMDADDETLAHLMYELIGREALYNFCIVSSYSQEDMHGLDKYNEWRFE